MSRVPGMTRPPEERQVTTIVPRVVHRYIPMGSTVERDQDSATTIRFLVTPVEAVEIILPEEGRLALVEQLTGGIVPVQPSLVVPS